MSPFKKNYSKHREIFNSVKLSKYFRYTNIASIDRDIFADIGGDILAGIERSDLLVASEVSDLFPGEL